MKKLILAILSVPVIFSACKKDDDKKDTDPTKARIMFVNGTLGADTIRVSANGSTVVNSLPYTGHSEYLSLSPGNTTISSLLAGSALPLKDTSVNFSANNNYSVFTAGTVTGQSYFWTIDNLTGPSAGMAKIRLVNLAQENLSETFLVGNHLLDSNIAYRTASPFREVKDSTYRIQAIDPSPSNIAKQREISSVQLVSGKIYTVILTGKSGVSGTSDLRLTLYSNN